MVHTFPVMNEKERARLEALEKHNKQLIKQLEEAQMKNIVLETLIDVAEEDLKINIRKKPGPKPWYCCGDYVKMLEAFHIQISMPENGNPYENALAERINGILKTEFGLADRFQTFDQASKTVAQAIHHYNQTRPHASVDYLTPDQAHQTAGTLTKRWKSKPTLQKQDTEWIQPPHFKPPVRPVQE